MTAYRFRVKFEYDPRSLWRDIVIRGDRTLAEFQQEINAAVGLNQDHLWFFGTEQAYWDSDVKYRCPREVEDEGMFSGWRDEAVYNAGETTIRMLDLEVGDRICFLFDYSNEWRFYAILKETLAADSGDTDPKVVKAKDDPVQQYP